MIVRKFIIPGKPMGKQRPRVLKNGISYTPKETVNYEVYVKQCYLEEYAGKELLNGPVKIKIEAYMPIPKSASKKIQKAMKAGQIRPAKKPDWDNIGKIITDALNGIAYDDDKQIVSCLVEKYYSDAPMVYVEIREIAEGKEGKVWIYRLQKQAARTLKPGDCSRITLDYALGYPAGTTKQTRNIFIMLIH